METLSPAELARYFTPEDLRRGAEWLRLQNYAELFNLALDLVLLVALSVGGPGKRLWGVLARRLRFERKTPLDRILGPDWRAGGVFLALAVLIRNVAAFPVNFYVAYVVAHRVGLSHEDLPSYLRRFVVGLVLVLASAAVLGAVLGTVRTRWPRRWWLVVGTSSALLLLVDAAWEPYQLRLHHSVKPLPASALRARLERLVADQHADVGEIMVVDASRVGTEVNAFVSGFGSTKQLILTDNLLAFGDEAVVGAVAHEIGHRRDKRLPFRLLLAGFAMIAFMWVVERTLRFTAARGAPHTSQGLPLVRLVVTVVLLLTLPLRMSFNRDEEREADALELSIRHDYDAYIAEQVRLARANASDPIPPSWLRPFMSHPSASERIAKALHR